jgi:hypothetical protein
MILIEVCIVLISMLLLAPCRCLTSHSEAMDGHSSGESPPGPVSHSRYTQKLHPYESKLFSRHSSKHLRSTPMFTHLSPTAEDALRALHRSTALYSLASLPTAQIPLDYYISPTALLTKHVRFSGFHVKPLTPAEDTSRGPEARMSAKKQSHSYTSIVSPPRIPSAVRRPCPYADVPVSLRTTQTVATRQNPPCSPAAALASKNGFWEKPRRHDCRRSAATEGLDPVETAR